MSAFLVVTNEQEAERLMPWALKIARSEDRELQVVIAQQKEGRREWSKVELEETTDRERIGLLEALRRLAKLDSQIDDGGNEEDFHETSIRRLRDPLPDRALLKELASCKLLIVALNEPVRDSAKSWPGRLFRSAPCETIFLRVPANAKPDIERILVPTDGKVNANAALRRADSIRRRYGSEITALYVEPKLDIVSKEAGTLQLKRIVRRALGNKEIRQKVIVSDQVVDGLRQAMEEPYDLVLVGAYRDRTIRRFFFGNESSGLFRNSDQTGFAAVRAGMPLGTRFHRFCERQVQRYVPQLDREDRVSLVDRVRDSSQWDFDFVALICLSTAIAAIGLVRNQSAVVIGAMLVAPLMTPLIGAGLAVVQGNGALIRCALGTVLRGFVVAFAIGYFIGLISGDGFTAEILGRTSPGLVDLAVALFGGIAAAYAMSRPNLSSALPGVAIAAALVPPIATVGITLAHGELRFALGALLLFLTNIVAIVMGTAFSLWLVGIRDTHAHGTRQSWTSWFMAFLLVATIGLGFAISRQAGATDSNLLFQLQTEIEAVIESSQTGAQLAHFQKLDDHVLSVVVESPRDEIGTLAEDLCEVAVKHFETADATVRLEVRHVVTASGAPAIDSPNSGSAAPLKETEGSL